MRIAIVTQLKTITELGNRVYQAYTAPTDTTKPYCTFKLLEDEKSFNNKHGEFLGLQIFIYNTKSSFTPLDSLAKKIKEKFDGVTITIDDSPKRYFIPEYTRTIRDIYDDVSGLFSFRLDFIIPRYRI